MATPSTACDALDLTVPRISPFDRLPDEILLNIFFFLPLIDICDSVIPVCKKWKDLVNYSNCWIHVDFYSLRKANERYFRRKNLLDHYGRCNRVRTMRCLDVTYNFIKNVVAKCTKLQHLIIQNFKEAPPGIFKLLSKSCPSLRSIAILTNPYNDNVPNTLVLDEIFLNKKLTEIAIVHPLSCQNLKALLKKNYSLDKLAVNIGMNIILGSRLIRKVQNSLRHLILTCAILTLELKIAIQTCHQLKLLDIVTCNSVIHMSVDHYSDYPQSIETLSLTSFPGNRQSSIPRIFEEVRFSNVLVLKIYFPGQVYSSGYGTFVDDLVSTFPNLRSLTLMESSDYFLLLQVRLFERLKTLQRVDTWIVEESSYLPPLVVERCRLAGIVLAVVYNDDPSTCPRRFSHSQALNRSLPLESVHLDLSRGHDSFLSDL